MAGAEGERKRMKAEERKPEDQGLLIVNGIACPDLSVWLFPRLTALLPLFAPPRLHNGGKIQASRGTAASRAPVTSRTAVRPVSPHRHTTLHDAGTNMTSRLFSHLRGRRVDRLVVYTYGAAMESRPGPVGHGRGEPATASFGGRPGAPYGAGE